MGDRKEAIPVLILFDLKPTVVFLPSLLRLQKPKLFIGAHFGPTESPSVVLVCELTCISPFVNLLLKALVFGLGFLGVLFCCVLFFEGDVS